MQTKEEVVVAYDVFDKDNKWLTGYSTDLDSNKKIGCSSLDMARQTASRHGRGAHIKARLENGEYIKVGV